MVEVKKILLQVLFTVYPYLLGILLYLSTAIVKYLKSKAKNVVLKNIYGWLNREIISIIDTIRHDKRFREELKNAIEDGEITKEEMEQLIKILKHDIMKTFPVDLLNEAKKLIGNVEDMIERQIRFFLSQKLQDTQQER